MKLDLREIKGLIPRPFGGGFNFSRGARRGVFKIDMSRWPRYKQWPPQGAQVKNVWATSVDPAGPMAGHTYRRA